MRKETFFTWIKERITWM